MGGVGVGVRVGVRVGVGVGVTVGVRVRVDGGERRVEPGGVSRVVH